MFRRNNRFFFASANRRARRVFKSILRANRNDARWLKRYEKRQRRLERFRLAMRRAFSFIPMVRRGLTAMIATMSHLFAAMFPAPTRPIRTSMSRSGMFGSGRKGRRQRRKNARTKAKLESGNGYENLEPRQMLAADLGISYVAGDNFINASEASSFTITGTAAPNAEVAFSGPGIVGAFSTTADSMGNFTSAAIDVSAIADGIFNYSAVELDGSGAPVGVAVDQGVIIDTSADNAPDLLLTVDDTINDDESTAVGFSVSGIDSDVAASDVIVSFTDESAMTVTASAADGTVDLSSLADGTVLTSVTATDDAGNIATVSGADITLDTTLTVPTLEIDDTTINAGENAAVGFSVSGVDSDVAASDAIVSFSNGSTTVTALATDGTVDLSSLDDGTVTTSLTVTDGAGNTATVDGADITLDTTLAVPTLTIDDTTINADESTAVEFTVSGIDDATAVVSFSDGSTTVTAPATNDTVATVDLSSLADGTVTTSVTVTDGAGNTTTVSGPAITLDATAPTVTVTQAASQLDPSFDFPVVFDVEFSEAVTGFDSGDVVIGGTAAFVSPPAITITKASPTEYTVSVEGVVSSPGTVTLGVPAGVASDSAGNDNEASTSSDNSVTILAREIEIEANDSAPFEDQVNNAQFTVSLAAGSPTTAFATTVFFEIDSDSTADLGVDPLDFVFGPQVSGPIASGPFAGAFSIVLPANVSGGVIDIDLQDDLLFDPGQTIQLNLLGAENANEDLFAIGASGSDIVTIIDDEAGPTVTIVANDPSAAEGDPSETDSGQFTIAISTAVDADVTVVLGITQISNGSDANDAVVDVDYTFSGSSYVSNTADTVTIVIREGETFATLDVNPISEDSLVELTELVELTLVSAVGGTGLIAVDNNAAVVEIADDDTAEVSITSTASITEGDPNGELVFTLTDPASTDTTVEFTQTGTPVYGVDYWLDVPVVEQETNDSIVGAQNLDGAFFNLAENSSIGLTSTSIPHITVLGSGDGSRDFYSFTVPAGGGDVRILADNLVGFDVNVGLQLRDSSGDLLQSASGAASALITDNLPAGTYTVRVAEGNGEIESGETYNLHLSVEGHATPIPTSVTIPAGATSISIPLSVVDDAILEDDEPVTFVATSVSAIDEDITVDLDIADNTTVTDIVDNELATVSISGGLNALEADVPVNGTFTISSDTESDIDITVPFEIVEPSEIGPSDAEFGVDYTFGPNVTVGTGANEGLFFVTLPADTPSPSVEIQVIPINELIVEQNETITLSLVDNAFNTTPGVDDSLQYDATADGDSDVVIGVGTDSILLQDVDLAVVTVNSSIDTAVEGGANGEFEIVLAERDGTLTDPGDPVTPIIPINGVTASIDTVVTYEITFTDPTPVSTGQPADPSDIPTTILTGSIIIPAGQDRVFIPLSAIDDSLSEGVEEVFLRVLSVTAGDSDIAIADPSTDADDDVIFIEDANANTVRISVDPDTIGEEDGSRNFVVELAGPPLTAAAQAPITVNYTVTGSATAGDDYVALSGTVVLPAGASPSATISVDVLEDTIVELDETVIITIDSIEYGGPANITIDEMNSDTLTITEDDTAEVIIDATDQLAGEGTDDGTFTVTLVDSESGLPVSSSTGVLVNYSIIFPNPVFGTPHATEGLDFDALNGSLFIAPNLTSGTISVNVIDDAVLEGSERVVVQLDSTGSPGLFNISTDPGESDVFAVSSGTSSVGNTDFILIARDQQVSVTPGTSAIEGNVSGNFVVSIDRPSTVDTVISFTLSGDAVEGTDFASTTGSVTILAGDTAATVTIDPITVGNDNVLENIEDVILTLDSVDNVDDGSADITIDPHANEATISISDDDFAYVTIEGVDNADEAGEVDGRFTVTLRDVDGAPTIADEDIVVNYTVTGSATIEDDFAVLTGEVTIPAGSESADIIISVIDDALPEGIEDVTITLDSVDSSELDPAGVAPFTPRVFRSALGGPVVSFVEGVDGYTGAQDAFIRQLDPAVNFGVGPVEIDIDNIDGPAFAAEQGLLQFDNLFGDGFGLVPAGALISSAELLLTSFDGTEGGTIALHEVLAPWNQNTITWLNANLGGNTTPGLQTDGIELSSLPVDIISLGGSLTSPEINTIDVTSSVIGFQSGLNNFGWAFLANSAFISASFEGTEGAIEQRPELLVTLSTSATIQINDDDTATIDITGSTPGEEMAAPTPPVDGVVTVELSTALPDANNLTVFYTVNSSGGSAIANSDFTPSTGSFVIEGGETVGTFDVTVLEDLLIEGNENVLVNITGFSVSGPNAAAVAGQLSLGTTSELVDIIDDDTTAVSVSVLSSGSETPAGTLHSDSVFRVEIDRTSTAPTEISFSLSSIDPDFAIGDDIATPAVATITIPAGALFADFTVNVLDDLINEDDESYTLTLESIVESNPGITIADGAGASATDIIEDDDDLVAVIDSSANPTASESPAIGDNIGEFTISLGASDRVTTVPFEVFPGSIDGADLPTVFNLAGNPESPDYELIAGAGIVWETPTTGFVTFAASETPQSTTITVVATQDFNPFEGDEIVDIRIVDSIDVVPGPGTVDLFNPNRPADFLGTPLPRPDNVDGAGDSAEVDIVEETFVVSLDPSDSPALEDGPPISGFNGQFTVELSNPVQLGNTVTVPFSVASDANLGVPNGSTIDTATYGEDYTFSAGTTGSVLTFNPLTLTGTVTIPGGQTQALISIDVIADNIVEGVFDEAAGAGLEDIELTLGTPVSSGSIATLGTPNVGTQSIIDNDVAEVNVSVITDLPGLDPVGIVEDSNDGGFLFTLGRPAQGRDVVITYFIVDDETTATAGDDYVPLTGTITIPAGETSAIAFIDVVADNLVEGNETLTIEIDTVTEVLAGTTTPADTPDISIGSTIRATAIIEDNDSATVSVFAVDADASEPTNPGIFEFTLSNPTAVPVTVTYSVGGDANTGTIGNEDFVPLSGTITFEAGETVKQVVVETLDDDVVENDETVIVTLDAETSLPLVTGSGSDTVVIASEDVALATLSTTHDASEEGPTAGVFTITLDHIADEDVTITLNDITEIGLGLATPADFGTSATVTIPAGTLSGSVNVTPVDDTEAEGPEDLTFVQDEVTSPDPYESSLVGDLVLLDPGAATITISDNDVPVFTVDDVTLEEGLVSTTDDGLGITTFTFTVSHNATSLAEDVTITPSLLGDGLGGTATTAGLNNFGQDDFDFTLGVVPTLVFTNGGPSSLTFTVDVFHDIVHEADETFTVSLTADTEGPLVVDASDTGTGEILNDDFVEFTIDQVPGLVAEGSNESPYVEGTAFSTVSFEITPSIPVDIDIPIAVDYDDGTAGGVNFASVFAPLGTQSLPFGTDFDNGQDTDTFLHTTATATTPADSVTVTVDVVEDFIVEGASGISAGFGFEDFTTILSSSDTERPGITFVNTTGVVHDDDGQVVPIPPPATVINPVIDIPAIVSVSASDPDASEPDAPFGDGEFTFSVTTPVQEDIVISYSFTIDGADGDPNGDLTEPLSGTITIPGSTTSATTSVTLPFSVFDDIQLEDDEDVTVTITGLSTDPNVDFDDTPATVTIQDDDTALISISVIDDVATEGSTTDTATLRISLTQQSDSPTTVTLVNRGTTGLGLLSSPFLTGSDFSLGGANGASLPATVTIPANTSFVDVTVTGLQDPTVEVSEDLAVEIVNPIFGNADVLIDESSNQALITILDDGDGFTVNAEFGQDGQEPGTNVGNDGEFIIQLRDGFGAPAIVPVGSTGPGGIVSGGGLEVFFLVEGVGPSPATPGTDFTFTTGSVVIPEGQSSNVVAINVLDDLEVEDPEGVSITITGFGTIDGTIATLAGEPIAIGDSVETLDIIDNDIDSGTQPSVAGIYLNGTDWTSLFRDRIDGVEDGSQLGYELTGRANQLETVPWVNVDQIIVEFDSPVTGIDLSDFDLSGTLGFTDGVPSVTPSILSAVAGPGNTAVLTLSGALQAANVTVQINASGIQSGSVSGVDTSYSFLALPGDSNNDNQVTGADTTEAASRQFQFIAPGEFATANYDFASDLNGDGFISGADVAAAEARQFDFVVPALPLPSVAAASSLAVNDDAEVSSVIGEIEELSLAGSQLDADDDEVAFDETQATQDASSGDVLENIDSVFESLVSLEDVFSGDTEF